MSWVTSTIVLPLVAHLVEDVDALLLEGGVADREHLVDQQDVGVAWTMTEKASRTIIPDE